MYAIEDMVEIKLKKPDDFLKIKETLTRIGIPSKKDKTLYQSCHILHKRGKYYIVHFKELFALDGRPTDFQENDIARRNRIVKLLEEWNLVDVITKDKITTPVAPLNQIKVIAYKEKNEWVLENKYSVGKKKQNPATENEITEINGNK